MRNLTILTTFFLLLNFSSQAQLSGIIPWQGLPAETLQTTITSNGNFMQLNTPSGNLFSIRLLQGANIIDIFNIFGIGYYTTIVVDPYTITAELIIPASPAFGLYDLEVITGDTLEPWNNQVTYTAPNAFTVGAPDGYITGTLYEDLNQDGIKDAGEPGLPGRSVKILPANILLTTDINGNYSYPALNGTFSVIYINAAADYMFVTSANDTLQVTINNANAPGNDFGLKRALTSISPDTGHAGVLSIHQIVSDQPIFAPGGGQNGNVISLSVLCIPTINATVATEVTVIDSFTVEVALQPGPSSMADSIDLLIGVTGTYSGTHYLRKKFTIIQADGVVAGNVYHDLNENGIKDTGEPGLYPRTVKLIETNSTITTYTNGSYGIFATNGNYTVTVEEYVPEYMFITTDDTLSVTINNAASIGNDFGLNGALISVTPAVGYQGVLSSHQITSSRPIFFPGGGPNGNVVSIQIATSPSTTVVSPANITVIDSFNIQFLASVWIGTQIGSNIDIIVGLNAGYNGNHYLRQQFSIAAPAATVSGKMFFDQNQNKINDPGEPGINNAGVQLIPDGTIAFSSLSGDYLLGSSGGTQTLSPMYNVPGLSLFTDSASYTFTATGSVTGKDFGFISTLPDYSIDVHSLSIFPRCNSQQNAYFRIRNLGNNTYNAIAWLKYSPSLTYISSSIPPSSISNDTIYWNISNIPPYGEIIVNALFLLPAGGFNIYLWAGAISLDTNNAQQLTDLTSTYYLVTCSMDPNDKQVTPQGIFAQHFTLMNDTLEYLIRFQNTGNDTAFNVVVLDTLDSDLDFSTFEILSSSHSVQTELQSNGALRFAFNNIMLVDSVANEPESHGYIQYRIRANTGLPDSTTVNNTAYIYFDFNAPVLTNTTLNTMVYVLPVGIAETNSNMGITVYPNPFSNSTTMQFENPNSDNHKLIICDLSGKPVVPEMNTRGNKLVIEKNKLAGGVYFYSLINTSTNHVSNGKLLIE